jgi:hypothetical protein
LYFVTLMMEALNPSETCTPHGTLHGLATSSIAFLSKMLLLFVSPCWLVSVAVDNNGPFVCLALIWPPPAPSCALTPISYSAVFLLLSAFRYLGTRALPLGKLILHILSSYRLNEDRLCGLVVRLPGCKPRGPGFDSRLYQILWVAVGLERGSLSPCEDKWGVTWKKIRGSGLENWD